MATISEVESTLTDRYQTTVPETIRRILRLEKRDKLRYSIRPGGEVVLTRADTADQDDPILNRFLGFLAHDIEDNPGRLQPVNEDFVNRIRNLVGDTEIDLNKSLPADNE